MKIWEKSDRGKVRDVNQDFVRTSLHRGDLQAVAVLCDGMGGANAGSVASRMAGDCIHERLAAAMKSRMSEAYMSKTLESAVSAANAEVYEASCQNPDYAGMGTTVVAMMCDGNRAVIANVGDSRAYLINDDGIRRITDDHSLVEEMLRRGELSREEAKVFPARNYITRAVGTEAEVACDLFPLELYKDDCVLICSDGLTNVVDEQEILYEVNNAEDPGTSCERLISISLSRGAPDNVSVILVKI